MAQQTEEKNLKNNNESYNQTSQGVKKCCCFESIPGLQYRTTVVFTKCPHCSHQGPTDVDAGWSIKNYLCCYYYRPCWGCWQLVKGKDYNLKDAVHKCGSCKNVISSYEAC